MRRIAILAIIVCDYTVVMGEERQYAEDSDMM